MAKPLDLRGRHALVTGAASGIGKATALEVARRGASLSLFDIDADGLEAAVRAAHDVGASAQPYRVDLCDPAALDDAAARVLSERGAVDVLVNNAGVAVAAPFLRTPIADWEWIFGVNLWAPLRLTRALLPSMMDRGSGQLVMVASLAGLVGAPGMVAYSTTKFALVGFAEALRLELAEARIGVTVVCPGFVRTNLARATRYHNAGFRQFLDEPPFWYGMRKERVAEAIVDGICARRPMVVLGPEKVGWWLKRVAPEAAFTLTRWVAAQTGIAASR